MKTRNKLSLKSLLYLFLACVLSGAAMWQLNAGVRAHAVSIVTRIAPGAASSGAMTSGAMTFVTKSTPSTIPNAATASNTVTAKGVAQSKQTITPEPGRTDLPVKSPKTKTRLGSQGAKQAPTGVGPSNDNCANAISVNACPFTDTKDTGGATDEVNEPQSTCTLQGNSVWYTVTAATNRRTVTVDTCQSGFDTAVMVWQVNAAQPCDFGSFVPIGCVDDTGACGNGLQTKLFFIAEANTTYKVQIGGFDGSTGALTVNITCTELLCDDIVVNGNLGQGSLDHPAVSGQQTPARLFRDGTPSTCEISKTCPGPFGSGSFTFDAYTFTNESNATQCVIVRYRPNVGCNVNAHAVTYLNSFSPTNLCLNYLADVGSSDDIDYSFEVPAGANFVVVIAANSPLGVGNGCAYQFSIVGNICCTLTCPDNITMSNDPNQCGAVVNYPDPTTTGDCGAITCSPASGSFFPVGTTTVTCMNAAGASCTFTVAVIDTQPPSITCPANVTAVTDQTVCAAPGAPVCVVVTFPDPTASDNCPGVTVACVPPSGTCFPVGVTTVTCTATDASGNTATCSFTVTSFDVALQDDSDPSTILLWNSATGAYRFCCKGITFTGIGKSTIQGCVFTLQHNPADRRVLGRVDKAVHAGTASIQAPPGTTRCTITDRNTLNDTLLPACQ